MQQLSFQKDSGQPTATGTAARESSRRSRAMRNIATNARDTRHFCISPSVSTPAQHVRNFLHTRVLRPLLRIANAGASPERLAWSLAIGLVIGINPLLGTTTVVMLLLAWVLRLNFVASQIGIHIMTPIQLLLFLPFVKAGTFVFRSAALPMSREDIFHLSHRHPLQLIRILWQWEWHALVIWAILAATLAPILAAQIRKALLHATRRHTELVTT